MQLRFEDVTMDGRLMPLALPPALGGLWRGTVTKHPGARNATLKGVIPILTRLTLVTEDRAIRVDRPVEARSGFQLAHDVDASGAVSRLFMNVWCDVHGVTGRVVPREPAGPPALAGRVFAEHVFTRPFAPRDQRHVTALSAEGYPELPSARHAQLAASTAGEAPSGATWLDDLAADSTDQVFTLDHTDSNQHVNSLVYIRLFLDAIQRRLAATGRSLRVRSRAVDIAYRKPTFVGDRVRAHVRLFSHDDVVGGAGFIATPGEESRPRCYVRIELAP